MQAVGYSPVPTPRSPNAVENGGAYSTFEVKISPNRKRHSVRAEHWKRAFIYITSVATLALLLGYASSRSPFKANPTVDAIKVNLEGNDVTDHRSRFLSKLKDQYPESMRDSMNFSIDPCRNFYEYSCGQWISGAQIAADQGSTSKSWDAAENNSYNELKSLMEADYPQDSEYSKIHDWYQSCMNTEKLDELGAKPLRRYLEPVESVKDTADLWRTMAFAQLWSIPTMISINVNADEKDPEKYDLFLDSGGLILPDATYYDTSGDLGDEDTATNKHNMQLLTDYIRTITSLAGYSDEEAELTAQRTVEIEQMLAEFQSDEPANDSDDYLHYHLSELSEHAPGIPWDDFFSQLGAACRAEGIEGCLDGLADEKARPPVVMDSPYFYQKLSEAFRNHTADYWVPYLRAHVIYNLSPLLSKPFLDATFRIDSELEGVEEAPPRWKKCVAAVKHALPGLVDRLYVQTVFPEKARHDAQVMMHELREAFVRNLDHVEWMDPETRAKAVEKARAIEFNIGAPKSWPSLLDNYHVSASSYFDNSMQAYHRKMLFTFSKLSHPVDRHEWTMKASTVNAYYDNGVTGLFLPAAMLQPPFFSGDYPPARNFGGIGTVMGHEFTHGFDDTGRKYDAKSRLREWWAKPAVRRFQKGAECIADLYGGFTEAGETLDGNNTLGENIADEGGVKISLEAFEDLYRREHKGKAPDDRERRIFFTSFAQNWCDKERLKSIQLSVQTDEHSPSVFRVNGVVSQSPAFASAFRCPVGAPMDPAHKCSLWKDTQPNGEELADAAGARAERSRARAAAKDRAAFARRRRMGGVAADFDFLAPGYILPDIRHR